MRTASRLLALLILVAAAAVAQTVQCRPLAKYKGWPIFEVVILAHPEKPYNASREEILSFCPGPMLPNAAAIDIVTNSYKRSSALGSLWKQFAVWGGSALVGSGAATNERRATYVGGALMLINGVAAIAESTRFDPTRYLGDFVPARVELKPGEGRTLYAIASR